MVNGTTLEVSCSRLGLPRSEWTKEGSYLAANEWLRKKLAEIQTIQPELDPDQAETVDTISRLMDWAATNAPDQVQAFSLAKAAFLKHRRDDQPILDSATVSENLEIARLNGIYVPEDVDPTILQHLFGNRRIYQDRLKRHTRTKKQQSIGYLLDGFLADLRLKQSPQTYDEIHRYLKSIPLAVWMLDADVASIGPRTVTSHYRWLASFDLEATTHNKRLGFFRRFVKWLYQESYVDNLPRNILSKDHRRRVEHRPVRTFTGVGGFVNSLNRDEKAWALLCLNCGMTAVDLGKLFWRTDNVDLWMRVRTGEISIRVCGILDTNDWTITRRRSKTGSRKESPTVKYKLWPETVDAVKNAVSHRAGLMFLHETGSPMRYDCYDETDGNQSGAKRFDHFGSAWRGKKIPLAKLRSVAAHALSGSVEYRDYRNYFLGHTPASVGEKHYFDESPDRFYEALNFIRAVLLD